MFGEDLLAWDYPRSVLVGVYEFVRVLKELRCVYDCYILLATSFEPFHGLASPLHVSFPAPFPRPFPRPLLSPFLPFSWAPPPFPFPAELHHLLPVCLEPLALEHQSPVLVSFQHRGHRCALSGSTPRDTSPVDWLFASSLLTSQRARL